MIRALLLDCDGVLADSEPLNHRCWSEAFRVHLGVSLPDDPSCIIGLDLARICELGCRAAGLPVDALDDAQRATLLAHKSALFLSLAPGALRPVRGARELVRAARARRMRLAVVSSALRARLERTLAIIDLDRGWDAVLAGEDTIPGHLPEKDWSRAAELLGLPLAACAVIEDSAEGVSSARARGAGVVIGVTTGLPEERLRRAGAHVVVPGPWAIGDDLLSFGGSCASP